MTRAGEEGYARLGERELSGAGWSAKMGRRRERRPDVESPAHLSAPAGPAARSGGTFHAHILDGRGLLHRMESPPRPVGSRVAFDAGG